MLHSSGLVSKHNFGGASIFEVYKHTDSESDKDSESIPTHAEKEEGICKRKHWLLQSYWFIHVLVRASLNRKNNIGIDELDKKRQLYLYCGLYYSQICSINTKTLYFHFLSIFIINYLI